MPTIRAKLVGQQFNQGARAIEDLLKPGRDILLVREPDNPYDSNAVEVYIRLGHINRETAAVLADLFDSGHTALPPRRPWIIGAKLGEQEKSIVQLHLPEPRPAQPPKNLGDGYSASDDDEVPF